MTDDPTAMPRARHSWAKDQIVHPIATSRVGHRAMGYIERWSLIQSRAERSWQPALSTNSTSPKAVKSALISHVLPLLSAWPTAMHQEPPWGAAVHA